MTSERASHRVAGLERYAVPVFGALHSVALLCCAINASVCSTMLDVRIDRSDAALLHDQVAAQIRRAIADGEAKAGERLPPARDMAAVMGVNTNTVLRALRLLRDEGLLELRQGRGIRVSGTPERGAVIARARELIGFAGDNGYRRDELVRIIETLI